jgi:uncharacterized protein YoxC
MIEEEAIKILFNLGAIGIVLVFVGIYGSKAIKKLYNDMTMQHKEQLKLCYKREDQLMQWLNKKNETDNKVAETLDNICSQIGCLNRKIEEIEKKIK